MLMPPRLLTASAVSPTEVRLGFDVAIEVTTAAHATFTTRTAPAVPINASAWSVDGRTVTIAGPRP